MGTPETDPIILVHTLGELHVLRDGEPVEELQSRPLLLALICYLALERSSSRDRLLNLFWEGQDATKARHSLSQALYTLRKYLGKHWIEADSRKVAVNEFIWSDLVDLDRDLERGDAQVVLERYQGSFLQGFVSEWTAFEHWASGRRAQADRAVRSAFREVIDAMVADGDISSALDAARAWIHRDPVDDEANHRLIEMLARSGDRSGALRRYELYRRALAEDDLTPLEQTDELVAAIRHGEPEANPQTGRAHTPRTEIGQNAESEADEPSPPERDHGSASASPPSKAPSATTAIWSGRATNGPRLVRVVEEGEEAEVYPLTARRTVVGRTEGDLRFPSDARMDTEHASFLVRTTWPDDIGGDRYIVRDEGSVGGVFVEIRGSWPLRTGDVFAVGQQLFRVDTDGSS